MIDSSYGEMFHGSYKAMLCNCHNAKMQNVFGVCLKAAAIKFCGNSSMVERCLAKAKVEGSNPFFRCFSESKVKVTIREIALYFGFAIYQKFLVLINI